MSVKPLAVAMVLVGSSACYKRNPNACCSTAVECEQVGFDDITPCLDLRVCVGGSCVAPECATSAECSAPTPYCVGQICSAACPDDSYCPADSPVCDDTSRVCRPCGADEECASGICLAAEGVCAVEADAVYVSMAGSDAGECVASAPCRTIPFALTKLTAQRRVLRLVSLDYVIPSGVTLSQDVYVDGNNTRVQRTTTGPIIITNNNADITIEGIRVESPLSAPAIDVVQAVTTISGIQITYGGFSAIHVGTTTATIMRSTFFSSDILCEFCILNVWDSTFEQVTQGAITGNNTSSTLEIKRNRFVNAGALVATGNPLVRFENNVVIGGGAEGTDVNIGSARAGSYVRFNTFVRPTPRVENIFTCTGTADVTSNVIASQTSTAISPTSTCPIRYSVSDSVAGTIPGTGNMSAVYSTIFIDAANGDYRPGPSSVARAAAEPGLAVPNDVLGGIRPQPTGTNADAGAYEVP